MTEAEEAAFPFADLKTGERWTLRPNAGRLPWWILDSRRRVPGTRAPDYFAPLGVLRAPADTTVGDVMPCSGPLYERLWRPVLLAALNTEPAESDARLAAQILRETLAAGGHACRPMVATGGLSAAFIEPALAYISQARRRGPASAIRFARSSSTATARSAWTSATRRSRSAQMIPSCSPCRPWWRALLIPGLTVPETFHAIVNAHFRIAPPKNQPLILGVINGMTEWIFAYPDRLSATISCADRLMEEPRQQLAETIWREVATLTGPCSGAAPLADRARTPGDLRGHAGGSGAPAGAGTRYSNLVLAGDWTDTGLPATIEGSIRSGLTAAQSVAHARRRSARRGEPHERRCVGIRRRSRRLPATRPARSRLTSSTGASHPRPTRFLSERKSDGHWCFELEADATIPSEYVLFRHFRGEPEDLALEAKIAAYLRRIQGAHGGWPLFHEGDFNMSASVKAYFALKMIGDPIDAPHMRRAREAILAHGGAAQSNVFTRALLALYGQVPWRAVPTMPVEIMLLPSWFPFHLDKVSYWARTVMVPLFVLQALKPKPVNARNTHIPELFVTPPEQGADLAEGRRIRKRRGRRSSARSTWC